VSKEVEFLVKLRDAAQMMADACQELLESKSPTQEPSQPRIPVLDLAQVNALPWKPYEKQPAGAWIFTNNRRPTGSDKLIEAVKGANGKLELGEYKYSLSRDPSKPFLSRWPTKKK
jgi:hypothetical protein